MTLDQYARLPRERRLERLALTPDQLAAGVVGRDAARLARRPDAGAWAPVEIVCHLRDNEEAFLDRFRQILAMDEERLARSNPERWAEERQYLTHDAGAALAAFGRRRGETLELLRALAPGDWRRAGVHLDSRGRRTLDEFLSVMDWHDDNHVDQLRRALEGRA
jgi:hypothetical protein